MEHTEERHPAPPTTNQTPPTTPDMAAVAPSVPLRHAQPVTPSERYETLDVLRGFALLGIFPMNITSFALLSNAYFDPTFAGVDTARDWIAWFVNATIFEQKMMTLFSILFGAGIVLFTDRAIRKGDSPAKLHYRRMGWLALFGFLHAYLLWYGDILFIYAICGMLAYLFRSFSPKSLFVIAGGLFFASCLTIFGNGFLMGFDPMMSTPASDELIAEATAVERPDIEGGYVDRVTGFNFFSSLFMHLWILPTVALVHNTSLMLIGMGLYKTGFLVGRLPSQTYAKAATVAFPVFAVALAASMWLRFETEFVFADYFKGAFQLANIAAVAAAIVYASVIAAVVRADALRPVRTALSAVGRIAFTNYIMQTVIACIIFYKPGFGLWMDLSRSELWLIVAAVWAFQIAFSIVYLRRFSMGPLEAIWRRLTYGPRPTRQSSGR